MYAELQQALERIAVRIDQQYRRTPKPDNRLYLLTDGGISDANGAVVYEADAFASKRAAALFVDKENANWRGNGS